MSSKLLPEKILSSGENLMLTGHNAICGVKYVAIMITYYVGRTRKSGDHKYIVLSHH